MPFWTDDQREEVVRRVERHARLHPLDFRARVTYFALIGYGYILAVLGFAVMVGAQLWLWLTRGWTAQSLVLGAGLLLVLLALVAIVRLLWVTVERPEGLEITAADAPALFTLIARLRRTVHGPQTHRVILTTECEAAVAQTPRLGWLGWHQNTLVLGFPLLCALTSEELEGVLAHELGHLAGQHGRLHGWISRVAATWFRVTDKLESGRYLAAGVFNRFLRWYLPWFSVYAAVLSRMQERVADRAAIDAVGARVVAQALLTLELRAALLTETLWPAVFAQAAYGAEPRVRPCRGFVDSLREDLPADQTRIWLEEVLPRRTALDATHPALAERLAALGFSIEQARHLVRLAGSASSAAHRVLGEALPTLCDRLDARWRRAVAPTWRERYAAAETRRAELAALEASAALTPDAACRRAELVADVRGDEAALPLLRELVSAAPRHAGATFALGRLLVERDDSEGVRLLNHAVSLDARLGAAAYGPLQRHAARHGETRTAQRYETLGLQSARRLERDGAERSTLSDRDSLAPPDLAPDVIARLSQAVGQDSAVQAAYLVRKELTVYPERPLHLVAIRGEGHEAARMQDLLLEQRAPGDVLPLSFESLSPDMQARLLAIAGDAFYSSAPAAT